MKFTAALRSFLLTTLLASAPPAFAFVVPVAEDGSTNSAGIFPPTGGTAPTLTVSAPQIAYLRFDLDVVPASITASNLTSATLTLYITKAQNPHALTIHAITSPWGEKADHKRTPPSIDPAVLATIPANDILTKHFVSIDLTPALVAALSSANNYGLAIQSDAPGSLVTFSSKEGTANGWLPTLELESNALLSGDDSINAASVTLTSSLTTPLLNFSGSNASITIGGASLINNFGTNNFFAGASAGSPTLTGARNTGIGALALDSATTGFSNTAVGAYSLNRNTSGLLNTAVGSDALSFNTTGSSNTAIGNASLKTLSIGSYNTALGDSALFGATTAYFNTALGYSALLSTTSGGNNTGVGTFALAANKTGYRNVALGESALRNNPDGNNNTALGYSALNNTNGAAEFSGVSNIAVGSFAGSKIEGSYNIDIGHVGAPEDEGTIRLGTQGTQAAAYLAGIYGSTAASGVAVYVDADGHLGTLTSSARFKREIHPMAADSEALLALQPVSFRYQSTLDPTGTPQFGLIAEQVEKVDPQLVAHDDKGGIYTVRYEAVNAMLLNEFLKEHRRVQHQGETIASQQKQIGDLTTQLATMNALLEKLAHRIGEPVSPAPQPAE